jgi:hypothetical protein
MVSLHSAASRRILSPRLGEEVGNGVGLSYRPAKLHSPVGSQGLRIELHRISDVHYVAKAINSFFSKPEIHYWIRKIMRLHLRLANLFLWHAYLR